jgi:hypothetical protein
VLLIFFLIFFQDYHAFYGSFVRQHVSYPPIARNRVAVEKQSSTVTRQISSPASPPPLPPFPPGRGRSVTLPVENTEEHKSLPVLGHESADDKRAEVFV